MQFDILRSSALTVFVGAYILSRIKQPPHLSQVGTKSNPRSLIIDTTHLVLCSLRPRVESGSPVQLTMATNRNYSSSGQRVQFDPKGARISKRQEQSATPELATKTVLTPTPQSVLLPSTDTGTFIVVAPALTTVTRRLPTAQSVVLPSDGVTSSSQIGSEIPPSLTTGSPASGSLASESLASTTESSDSASTSQSSDGNEPTAASQDNGSGSSELGGGAIAGIAIASVLIIALVGGWFFWRRRKRTRRPTSTEDSAHIGIDGGIDGGIAELHTQERPQEMPESRQAQMQELDQTKYFKHAMGGSHELENESEPAELLNGPDEYTAPVPHDIPQRPAAEMMETTNNIPASNVEAQRRREMEWLEMEEERMRKRRELLAAQVSAKS